MVPFVRFDPADSTVHGNDQRVSNGSHSIIELVRISSFKESYFSSSKIGFHFGIFGCCGAKNWPNSFFLNNQIVINVDETFGKS